MIFGKKIRELRDEQGVLQRQLAALLEIDTPMFSKTEGKLEERYNNAKALKENGVPVTIISVSLGLSVEEVEEL